MSNPEVVQMESFSGISQTSQVGANPLMGATQSAPMDSAVVSGSGFPSEPIATHLLSRMESQNHPTTQDTRIGAPVGMPVPLILVRLC
ncbi:hypothetical protein Nepgr_032613 [Nepenthes gracilis]|uniref:Uncharacterized protein n=1 Tax=Nepenthes gracilis TaxID=150966 RepID=A0AAD3TIY2_NEPGR|nr:hypothetical protein Nepgr_032613 [Nepenthes gracilis]